MAETSRRSSGTPGTPEVHGSLPASISSTSAPSPHRPLVESLCSVRSARDSIKGDLAWTSGRFRSPFGSAAAHGHHLKLGLPKRPPCRILNPMAALSRALVGRHEARAVTRLLEGVGPALVLLACLVSQARGVIYPQGPAGSCPDTLVIRNVQDSTVACHPAVDDTVQGVRGVITAFDNKPTGFAFY